GCVADGGVPYGMAAGSFHVIFGVSETMTRLALLDEAAYSESPLKRAEIASAYVPAARPVVSITAVATPSVPVSRRVTSAPLSENTISRSAIGVLPDFSVAVTTAGLPTGTGSTVTSMDVGVSPSVPPPPSPPPPP